MQRLRSYRERRALFCAIAGALAIYLLLASAMNLNLTAHSAYDSYTLQALAWRQGRVALDRDYPWLELAKYDGGIYVSFPPFPTLIMLPLTFIFGANTPSLLVNMCLFLSSCALLYAMMRRLGHSPELAASLAVFGVCGCNLLEVSLNGGVWNVAQGASFSLTCACLLAMEAPTGGPDAGMALGPLCIAFAVGCRPFQALYVPYVLFRLYRRCARDGERFPRTVRRMIPWLILPALVAAAYGAYNWARFGNPFEFGHNYLPEFSTQGGRQFSPDHWFGNLQNILRLPWLDENRLVFPKFFGFAFYLCNPAFLLAALETLRRALNRTLDAEDVLLLVTALVHFNLLLLHRTFGGWQFGTRYLIDLIPALLLFTFRRRRRFAMADAALMMWGVAFNAYGAAMFHLGEW